MLKLFDILDSLNSKLHFCEVKEKVIEDYRVVLGVNNNIVVYIKGASQECIHSFEKDFPLARFVNADIDDLYDVYFEKDRKVCIEDSRVHLTNLVDTIERNKANETPIISFYSYKGGVGRSTTLASFAAHLAVNKELKVVILDCDLEAPGLSNFFLEDPNSDLQKEGLVEYFLDSEICDKLILKNYYTQVSRKFTGKGEIYLFPAGNLSVDEYHGFQYSTDLIHYLNGLSRLDIYSKDTLFSKFESLFVKINLELEPDVILIDSRTGFNDIFGVVSMRLSDIVVGFFGSDIQTRPGINFFLDILSRKNAPRLMVAHSIIPADQKTKLHRLFSEYIDEVIDVISDRKGADNPLGRFYIERLPISDNGVLRFIGKPTESYEEFVGLIQNQDFSDYKIFFAKLYELLTDVKSLTRLSSDELDAKTRELQQIV